MMGEVTQDERAWYDVLGKFKDKAAEFQTLYNQVLQTADIAAKNPALLADYNKLVSYGATVRKGITNVTATVDTGYNWLKNTIGMDAVMTDSRLGFLPVIPLAVVAASIAAMTKFATDTYIYMDKVNQFKTLEAKYGAAQAGALVAGMDKRGGLFDSIGGAVLPGLVIAGVALFIFRKQIFGRQ